MTLINRTNRSLIGSWWLTIDVWLLAAVVLLPVIGFMLLMAAGPAAADRLGLERFHFVWRQAIFLAPAALALFAVSMMDSRQVIRFAIVLFAAALGAMILTLFIGVEVNGASRWLSLGAVSIQPSEFVKPALVVLVAWLLANDDLNGLPGREIAAGLLAVVVAVLVMQPDFGQTALVIFVCLAVAFMNGLPMAVMGVIGLLAGVGVIAAYFFIPHVASRIDRFLDPASGDTFQVDRAIDSFHAGGWFGRGPGEGVVKRSLPDAHTDYILAVAAEEYGAILCGVVIALFAFIVLRGLFRTMNASGKFERLAATGLLGMFGLQAFINIAVTLSLLPAKGITLPFISYGGSSLLAVAITMGLVLTLTRNRRDRSWA